MSDKEDHILLKKRGPEKQERRVVYGVVSWFWQRMQVGGDSVPTTESWMAGPWDVKLRYMA